MFKKCQQEVMNTEQDKSLLDKNELTEGGQLVGIDEKHCLRAIRMSHL